MFAFQLLSPLLADYVLLGGQVAVIGTPAVGVKASDPKGREQRFELQQWVVLS